MGTHVRAARRHGPAWPVPLATPRHGRTWVWAVTAWKREPPCVWLLQRRTLAWTLATLLLPALAGCSGGGQPALPATPTPIYAPQPTATYTVRLLDDRRFQPAELRGDAGQLVKLVLIGSEQKHDLTSPDLNINLDVPPGQVEIIDVQLPSKAGTYDFWSAQPGDREGGMVGHFIVLPAGQPSASA